jgi:hypothetical protein
MVAHPVTGTTGGSVLIDLGRDSEIANLRFADIRDIGAFVPNFATSDRKGP